MKALRLLANGNFITVNKCVAKSIGLNEAVILGALCSECVYCEGLNRIEDGFFPFSIEQLQEETTLGRKLQDKAISNLIASGIIEQKNCGVPNKRHFRIDEEKVEDLLLGRTSLSQQDTLVCPVGTNCIAPQGQTNSNKVSKKECNKVEEDYISSTQVTGSDQPSQDEMIHNIIEAWNHQKCIRAKIDRIVPMSKRYNDTFLTISQFGYDAFLYQICSLHTNDFFEEWQPSYDWFCDPNNFNKVYDGNYQNLTGKKTIDWENL